MYNFLDSLKMRICEFDTVMTRLTACCCLPLGGDVPSIYARSHETVPY